MTHNPCRFFEAVKLSQIPSPGSEGVLGGGEQEGSDNGSQTR